jgi:hypothetical protein
MATKTAAVDQATRDAIHRALPGPKGNRWSTAVAVADAVGKAYSTVTENLRAMAADGRVESRRLGRNTVWRKVHPSPKLRKGDIPTPRAATVDPIFHTPPSRAKPATPGGPSQASMDPATEAPGGAPPDDVLDAEIVEDAPTELPAEAPPAVAEKPRREPSKAPLAVWGKGALQAAILAHVQGLPEGESVTPHQVARAINSGSGAVAYGLDRLVTKGNVAKVSKKPQRYAAV